MSTILPIPKIPKNEQEKLILCRITGWSLKDIEAGAKITTFQAIAAMKEHEKDRLTEFLGFLMEQGYVDSDVYDHPPTAIDKFLNPKLR